MFLTNSIMSPDEQVCMRHFKKTFTRNEQGRFVLRLPFREKPDFPNSREIAKACLNRLLKRFSKQPELAKAYQDFIGR